MNKTVKIILVLVALAAIALIAFNYVKSKKENGLVVTGVVGSNENSQRRIFENECELTFNTDAAVADCVKARMAATT